MAEFKLDNNTLAIIAIVLIVLSSMNFMIASYVMRAKHVPTAEFSANARGTVTVCSSAVPYITANTTFLLTEDVSFRYDVNATGENESTVLFTDNTTMFNISSATGIISFTPSDDDVGISYVGIVTTETVCNTLHDSKVLMFNVTNVNDIPDLTALLLTNSSSTGNATYYFPISRVDLWEDVAYTFTMLADDPDLHVPPPYTDKLTYGKIRASEFFLVDSSTGRSSFMPLQADVGNYTFDFYVYDKAGEIDYHAGVLFIVHNVNDPPVLQNKTDVIGGLGSMMADWSKPFYYDVNATDEDDDTLQYGVQFLNCSKLSGGSNCTLFGIDSATGGINFTPLLSDIGNYTINYTVTDGIASDWYVGSFAVKTWDNLPPNITSWYPPYYNVNISEGDVQVFNITVTDDYGIPTAFWYINGNLVHTIAGEAGYNYTYISNRRDAGIYNITVVVSDGNLTDYNAWRLYILKVDWPSGEGGGGGFWSVPICNENWRCTEWSVCSRDGIQLRICVDLSRCGTTENKPAESASCIFTLNPSCLDGVKNCHGGSCEILTDCGGPCPACPTCSDGIRNCHISGQCEESVDCGGPCPPCAISPRTTVCGNAICEAGELYDCIPDCMEFWINVAVFMLIVILLIIVSILLYVYRKETVLLYIYRKMSGK